MNDNRKQVKVCIIQVLCTNKLEIVMNFTIASRANFGQQRMTRRKTGAPYTADFGKYVSCPLVRVSPLSYACHRRPLVDSGERFKDFIMLFGSLYRSSERIRMEPLQYVASHK